MCVCPGLQSVAADRKGITPNGHDVTNDTMQQVAFLSSRIYQQTTGGAKAFGRLFPHSSSAALPETSSVPPSAHQRHCGRNNSSCLVKGGEKRQTSASSAATMTSSRDTSCQTVTTKRHLTPDCLNSALSYGQQCILSQTIKRAAD